MELLTLISEYELFYEVVFLVNKYKSRSLIYLSDFYKIVKRFSFRDHHRYSWKDINRIQEAADRNPTAAVLTTEKDAQRLLDYSGMPDALKQRLFMVPITVEFLSDDERDRFAEFVENL